MAYDENSIKTLDWREHIRMRPGMYIGKLGDGASPDDGIYVLLKEVIDNSIDEFVMGFGKKITIDVTPDGLCEVRDFGRGIPLGKLLDCAAKINTGAKYDSDAFKKSVGLNGVGIKAVNALSDFFEIQAYRDGKTRSYQFCRGKEIPKGRKDGATEEPNGTRTAFHADPDIFPAATQFRPEYIEKMCRYYSYLNQGLGEISPQEFKAFIGEGMRLDRVRLEDSHKVKDLLSFYMGKNTRERQEYILKNLRVELDPVMD